jgi:S1-C subfamily serine protease
MTRWSPYLVPGLVGGAIVATALVATTGGDGTRTTTVAVPPATRAASATSGAALSASELYRRAAPGVVYVRTPRGSGAGFEVDRRGYIATNAHVVDGASRVTVALGAGGRGQRIPARVIGADRSTDVAVLKVDPGGAALHPLGFADSSAVAVGDATFAIGNPFGLDRTLTTGVVSAVARRISAPNGFSIGQAIQTDAALNPGNSGGPLLDDRGQVIGINSQITAGSSVNASQASNSGIGFAVPSNTAKRVVAALIQGRKVQHAYLGVGGVTVDASISQLRVGVDHGVLVDSVTPGGPADRAGLRAGTRTVPLNGATLHLGGDVILAVGGRPVASSDDLATAIEAHRPSERVAVLVWRDGRRQTVSVTLGDQPAQARTGA